MKLAKKNSIKTKLHKTPRIYSDMKLMSRECKTNLISTWMSNRPKRFTTQTLERKLSPEKQVEETTQLIKDTLINPPFVCNKNPSIILLFQPKGMG